MVAEQSVALVCNRGHKWNGCVTVGPERSQGLPNNTRGRVSATEPSGDKQSGLEDGIRVHMAATGPKGFCMCVRNEKAGELERAAQPRIGAQKQKGKCKGDPDRLNSSQRHLIAIIASHQVGEGFVAFSKRDLTELLGRSGKTVDSVVSNLRRRGLIEVMPRYAETGGQISSAYRVTDLAREKHPALL